MKLLRICIIFVFLLPFTSKSELFKDSQTYCNLYLGLKFQFGYKINRIGWFLGAYGVQSSFQISTYVAEMYNFNSYGADKKGFETQISASILVGYGNENKRENYFNTIVSNHTNFESGVGYAYNLYFDQIGTSQRTGSLFLHFDKLLITHENDIFGEIRSDKFRSAAVYAGYRFENEDYMDTYWGLNATLWHGRADSDSAFTVTDTYYPSRFGYRDLTKAEYGHFSHGFLSLQVDQSWIFYQNLRVNIGVDSEHVRNVLQNKIIHDMYFLPKKVIHTQLPNYPMLDETGFPYLYLPNQKIKTAKFFYSLGLNSGVFY